MKPFLILVGISCLLWGACKKNAENKPVSEVHGTLYFQDPAVDGAGHFFRVDITDELLLSPDFKDPKYKQYINVHTSLKFIDLGVRSCFEYGMVPGGGCPLPYRSVNVVSFTKLP